MRLLKAATLVLLFLFGIVSVAQEIHTDYDHGVNFSRYRTYSWAKVQTENPLFQQRVVSDVNQALQKLGWREVPSGGDIAVAAVGATHNEREYQTFYNGFPGWYWGGFGQTATTSPVSYRVGTLVVDLYDNNSKRLVWRGTATDTVSDDPGHNREKLSDAVEKMLAPEKFPEMKTE